MSTHDRTRRTAPRRWAGLTAALAVVLIGLAFPTSGTAATPPALAAKAPDAFSTTKQVTRTFVDADGAKETVSDYQVTVKADQTKNLRGRQRIRISWSGAQPSGGRASNPYGEKGLAQEYPVVVMQCRGRDGAGVPAAQRLRPETCWTASVAQRSQVLRSEGEALAEALDSAGVPVDCRTYPGVAQGFFGLGLLVTKALFAQGDAAEALGKAFAPGRGS